MDLQVRDLEIKKRPQEAFVHAGPARGKLSEEQESGDLGERDGERSEEEPPHGLPRACAGSLARSSSRAARIWSQVAGSIRTQSASSALS